MRAFIAGLSFNQLSPIYCWAAPPLVPLPFIVLRSSKQLRGDGDGVDECNSWSTVVQIEFLPQDNSLISLSDISSSPTPRLQHHCDCTPSHSNPSIYIFMMPSSTPRRLCHILKILFLYQPDLVFIGKLSDFALKSPQSSCVTVFLRVLYLHIARKCHLAKKFTAQAVCLPHNRK